jgi:hypothetical protein
VPGEIVMAKDTIEFKLQADFTVLGIELQYPGNRQKLLSVPRFGKLDRKLHIHKGDMFKVTIEKVKA